MSASKAELVREHAVNGRALVEALRAHGFTDCEHVSEWDSESATSWRPEVVDVRATRHDAMLGTTRVHVRAVLGRPVTEDEVLSAAGFATLHGPGTRLVVVGDLEADAARVLRHLGHRLAPSAVGLAAPSKSH